LQSTILDDIKHKLTDRKALLELTRAYHERWAERQQTIRVDRDNAERQLNRVMVQIDRIVTAISDSDEPVKGLVEKLKTLETERASLAKGSPDRGRWKRGHTAPGRHRQVQRGDGRDACGPDRRPRYSAARAVPRGLPQYL
jgi:hypothetical protein